MTDKIISKANFDSFLQKVATDYDCFAPVREGSSVVWSSVDKADDLVWDFSNTDMSPKHFLFPQTERLMHFKNDPQDPEGMIMEEEPPVQKPRALLNIRPCDVKSFHILDKVFLRDDQSTDPYWKDKRDKTLLIGLACKDPCATCFCTSVNCGPHHQEGLDILIIDLGEKLLLRPLTENGEKLTEDLQEASQEEVQSAENQKQESEQAIVSSVSTDNILKEDLLKVYEHPCWDRVFESCLNCGTCTFYCPTCHCFDIQDETQGDFGVRSRNWDTCMSWLFTYHTSGHNPRGTKKDRVRQRFMHKFKYMPVKLEGSIGCVGCGRCIQKCPVNIDIREVINTLNEQPKEEVSES